MPWRTPRSAPDPGGPCPHCPPPDPEQAKKKVELIDRLSQSLSGKDLADAVSAISKVSEAPPCGFCKGTGYVRVCSVCDGHAVLEKKLVPTVVLDIYEVEEEVEVEPEVVDQRGMVMRPAKVERQMVKKSREVLRDCWQDGAPCTNCMGGLESITKEQVGGG